MHPPSLPPCLRRATTRGPAPVLSPRRRPLYGDEAVEVLSSIPNLKQWLRLRDRHAAFDDAKAQGYAGFPALLLEDDRVILDESKLKKIFIWY